MNRALMWAIGSGLVITAIALVFVMAEPGKGPVFIAGDQPVTEDQIRQQLQSDAPIRDARLVDLNLAVFMCNSVARQELVCRAQRPAAKIDAIATSASGTDRTSAF